jgi:hypothetical protein
MRTTQHSDCLVIGRGTSQVEIRNGKAARGALHRFNSLGD